MLVEDILKVMDLHHQVDLILLDFTKAFDTVPHKRFLTKLHYYGIYGPLHDQSLVNYKISESNY